MAAKKKAKSKKSKGDAAAAGGDATIAADGQSTARALPTGPPPLREFLADSLPQLAKLELLSPAQAPQVFISVRCAELPPLQFTEGQVPTTMRLARLHQRIQREHGETITNIVLYRDKVSPQTRLPDDPLATLASIGIEGQSPPVTPETLPRLLLLYDFTCPRGREPINNPILLLPPHQMLPRYGPAPLPRGMGVANPARRQARALGLLP